MNVKGLGQLATAGVALGLVFLSMGCATKKYGIRPVNPSFAVELPA